MVKKYGFLLFLILLMGGICGFNWGFGHADKCGEARKLLPKLTELTGEKAAKQENRILALCPDGGAGHYIQGVRLERQKKPDEAIDEYRVALDDDDSIAEAHGNLGLLLLNKGEKDEAGVELTRGLMGSNDPRYHLGLAEILREGKMYALARFHYRCALKAFPDDTAIQSGLAEVNEQLGHLDEAEEGFTKLLDANPNDKIARLGLAEVYRKGKRWDDAMAELEKVAAANPGERSIHALMAEVYRDRGDMARADKEYLLAGVDKTITPEEYLRKGDEFLLAREYEKAIGEYRDALKKKPQWPLALEKLGDAQMAAGLDDDAIAAYTQAVRLDGGNSGISYSLGVILERKGELDGAVAKYQDTLRHDPDNGDARRRLADIYTLRGSYPQAIAEYKELIARRADNPLVHFKLAKVYDKSKDYPAAIGEYQAAIKIDPGNIEARKELAALYGRRGMADEAEGEFREVLQLKKDDVGVRNALTALYVRQRKYDDLFALLKEGADLFPKDPNSHYRLGIMYDFRKEYDAAIAQYQEAIALKSDFAKALSALGKTYMKTGNLEKAKESLEAAKKADPNFKEPGELLSSFDDVQTWTPVKESRQTHLKARIKKKHRLSKVKKGKKAKKAKKAKKTSAKKKKSAHASRKKTGRH